MAKYYILERKCTTTKKKKNQTEKMHVFLKLSILSLEIQVSEESSWRK